MNRALLLGVIGVCSLFLLAPSPGAGQEEAPNYVFIPGEMYRMPTHFGPSTGPRRGPDGIKFENEDAPRSTSVSVRFLTDRDQVQELLPEGFTVGEEPVVSVSATYIEEIPWLAGRGYNILGVSVPAEFHGEEDEARGSFLFVLWENLTDPIITGREELGFSKVYAELPPPRVFEDETHVTASWMGFEFLDMHLTHMEEVDLQEPADDAEDGDDGDNGADGDGRDNGDDGDSAEEADVLTGQMHYKYFPRTPGPDGKWGEADASYAVITPSGGSNSRTLELQRGEGTVEFHEARWEDMPTQYMIVNAFADLEVLEWRGATISKSVGGKDLSDQRVIR